MDAMTTMVESAMPRFPDAKAHSIATASIAHAYPEMVFDPRAIALFAQSAASSIARKCAAWPALFAESILMFL